jgi:RNA 3'-terminal phosphate cyclase (ATP)
MPTWRAGKAAQEPEAMVVLDGSHGEGGGQILRSALALSVVTARPFRITGIRAGRRRPGLRRQHLAAVAAAAEVGGAEVDGAAPGSQELRFHPRGPTRHGALHFRVRSAGSATLVVQTVLPALLTAEGPSTLTVEGGTHNPAAPPFEFLAEAFLPLLARMGPSLSAELDRAGFYPRGGGRLTVRIQPAPRLAPLLLVERGALRSVRAEALVAGLPRSVGERELAVVRAELELPASAVSLRQLPAAWGPGNAVLVRVESEGVTEVFTGFGERGTPAETVGRRAAAEARRYLRAGVAVGEHLADQLLLPLALAGAGSFTTLAPSAHARTNLWVLQQFLPVAVETAELGEGRWRLDLR